MTVPLRAESKKVESRACGGSAAKLSAAIALQTGTTWLAVTRQTLVSGICLLKYQLKSISQRCRCTEPMANYDSSCKALQRNTEEMKNYYDGYTFTGRCQSGVRMIISREGKVFARKL